MVPGVFGAGVTQLNLVVSTAVASLLPTGAVSYLYYADRLNQLPLAVVGIAVGTAILPLAVAPGAARRRWRRAAHAEPRPRTGAVPHLAGGGRARRRPPRPIMTVLFERGAFGPAAAPATAAALAAYAAGLPAFVLIKVMAPGFFARHDTATPVKIAFAAMAHESRSDPAPGLLTLASRHVGIAAATSIAGLGQRAARSWSCCTGAAFHARRALAPRGAAHPRGGHRHGAGAMAAGWRLCAALCRAVRDAHCRPCRRHRRWAASPWRLGARLGRGALARDQGTARRSRHVIRGLARASAPARPTCLDRATPLRR